VWPDKDSGLGQKEQRAAQNNEAADPHDKRDPKPFREKLVQTPCLWVLGSELLEPRPFGAPILGGDDNRV